MKPQVQDDVLGLLRLSGERPWEYRASVRFPPGEVTEVTVRGAEEEAAEPSSEGTNEDAARAVARAGKFCLDFQEREPEMRMFVARNALLKAISALGLSVKEYLARSPGLSPDDILARFELHSITIYPGKKHRVRYKHTGPPEDYDMIDLVINEDFA